MANDPRDYKLEVSGLAGETRSPVGPRKPFLSVRFACCNVYQRIYRAEDGSCYRGRCPRCGKAVMFPIAANGSPARSFVVR